MVNNTFITPIEIKYTVKNHTCTVCIDGSQIDGEFILSVDMEEYLFELPVSHVQHLSKALLDAMNALELQLLGNS